MSESDDSNSGFSTKVPQPAFGDDCPPTTEYYSDSFGFATGPGLAILLVMSCSRKTKEKYLRLGLCLACGGARPCSCTSKRRAPRKTAGLCMACGGPKPCKCGSRTWNRRREQKLCGYCGLSACMCLQERREEYKKSLEEKAGRSCPALCENCRERPASCWDHVHNSDKPEHPLRVPSERFRGWLCRRCNILARSEAELVRALAWVRTKGRGPGP